tara:strand:+ start:86 stop:805 length:720 start_codon:yes stop_codon:yes gene_type:complete
MSKLKLFFKHISNNYNVIPLSKWDGTNSIILRHDVDLDLESAYRLSYLEEECAICSSFFILMSGHCYNPLSKKNRDMLISMSKRGFDIGLHFDASIYSTNDKDLLLDKVKYEANLLSEIINEPVKSISLHNPARYGSIPIFDGFNNAYNSKIFSEEKYISDSRMIFKHDIYEFVKRAKKDTIQILLHPMHYTETGGSYLEVFENYFMRLANELDAEFGPNKTYRKDVKDGLATIIRSIN